jgi:PAS domain S-box-containing protein
MATDTWVLQALADTSDEAVFALDRDLCYLAFNTAHAEAMRTLYGAEIELGGCLCDYQTVAADREGARYHVGRALAGERLVVSAYSGEEGRARRFYDLVHVPLTRGDEVVGVVIRTQDVTERKLAEQALRTNERSFATLLDNIPDVVFHIDRDYRLVVANAAFSAAVVAAGGSAIMPGDLVLPSDYPDEFTTLWRDAYDRALGGESLVMETTVPMDDGAHTMENHLHPVRDDAGATVGVVVTSRDVTERRRTEEVRAFLARTASGSGDEPFFEALARYLATSLDMDFVCIDRLDPDGLTAHTLAMWTDGHFEDNVSYALKDTPCGDVVGQTVCCFPEGVQRSFPDDEVLQELCAESYVGVTLFSHAGEPIGLIAVIGRKPLRDRRPAETILESVAVRAASELERLDAEEELRETRDYLENLFGYANAPVIVWDAELRVTRFNHAFEELTRRSAEEVVGRHLELLFPEDERRAEALDHVTSATTGGERWQVVEIPILRADGEVRTVLWNSATVLGADGVTPVATIAQGQDITERTLAEAEIKRLNTDLERRVAARTRDLTAANAELEEFVYSIAHDLRSPLRSLSGFSQIIDHDYAEAIDETGRDYLRRIRDAAGHLGELMDALMSLSRIGRQDLELHDVDLSALAQGVAIALCENDPGRLVDFEIEQGLVARGDTALCEIIVQNLIGNAWKFSAAETPALIRFTAERQDGRRVFCVSDNGVGFEPEYAGKLFAPFERLHTTDEFPGTGIGLATVRRAVTRLGGTCWADAEQGSGARLYFTLEEPG